MEMRALVLFLALGGCSQTTVADGADLSQPRDLATAAAADLAGVDFAGADLARPAADLAGADLAGANACEAAGGVCVPGDFVQPMCMTGWHEDVAIEMANPGVCGLGICCIHD
jgi:hypothetical protein